MTEEREAELRALAAKWPKDVMTPGLLEALDAIRDMRREAAYCPCANSPDWNIHPPPSPCETFTGEVDLCQVCDHEKACHSSYMSDLLDRAADGDKWRETRAAAKEIVAENADLRARLAAAEAKTPPCNHFINEDNKPHDGMVTCPRCTPFQNKLPLP